MSKTLAIVLSAVVAAATTWAPAAEARGGGGHRGGGGGGMRMSHPHHNHGHLRFRRDSVAAPSYKTEEQLRAKRTATKPVMVPTDKGLVVKHADSKGRVYDLASKVWCDGNNHCWSGKHAWTFKDGAWFYGTNRWYEVGGIWRTDASEAPTAVDCETVPAFAAIKPTTAQEISRRDLDASDGGQPGNLPQAPATTVDKAAAGKSAKADGAGAKPGECRRYFPSVGAILPVPCEG